jgi:SsrA-binding protein
LVKSGKSHDQTGITVLARHRKALFEYEVFERIEAGIALVGSEVKSIRAGKMNLKEAYGRFDGGELFLVGAHVAEYTQAHARNHDPVRKRKLLLHRRELDRLARAVARKGLTLVPIMVYARAGRIKVELGLCRGKKTHDKRASIKQREQEREIRRAVRGRR